MPPDQDGARERVGLLLVQRRIEIDPRYRNRRTFAAERGMNWRLLHDIERAKRANFEPETLAAVEVAYDLAPGAIARALAGGDLAPRGAPPAPREQEGGQPRRRALASDDPDLRPWMQGVLRDLYAAVGRQFAPGREVPDPSPEVDELLGQVPGSLAFAARHEQAIWDTPEMTPPEKRRLLAFTRKLAAEWEARDHRAGLSCAQPAQSPAGCLKAVTIGVVTGISCC